MQNRRTILIGFAAFLAAPAWGRGRRSGYARAAFVRMHPCPATGAPSGPCPGYVVDHVEPLCAGGADAPANMQWQERDAALEKDREERAICRR
jgi:hypothetical protein